MDHYQTLGVSKQAAPDEIKKAYRKLASKHHPDREGGDTATFQKIEEAYRILSDPQQRQAYDNPQPQFNGGFPGGFSFNFGGGQNPFDDILRQFHHQQQRPQQRVYTVSVNVTLEQIARGQVQHLTLNTGEGSKAIEIETPMGIEDGQQVRYDGIMPDGVLMVSFRVLKHNVFERNGLDLQQKYEVSIWDLLLGTTIHITDINGNQLEMDIPPRTKPNTTMRLAGRGLSAGARKGNHYLLLSAKIPDIISVELLDLIRQERNKVN